MRSGITRRWLRGSLLITVLLVLLVEVMFLYSATRSYYNGVQQTMYRRFSSITGQLKMYTGETSQKTAASRSVALRRMVEQFSDKDKYEFMLLDSYGGVIASSSGTDAEGIVTRTDFEQAQDAVDGQGIAIYRTQSGEMVMAACCLVPYAAEDVAAMRLVTSLTLVEEQLKRTVVVALIMGAAVLAFTIMSGLYFVRSIVVPLGQVERTAAGIARGELDVRLPVTGDERDEVDRLRGTINRMAEGLEETEKMKNEFISSVSHELRTPLAILQTKLELFAEEHPAMDAETAGLIRSLREQLDRLTALVRTLLEMSNLQSVSRTDQIALAPLVEEILTDLTPLAQKNNISLQQDCEELGMVGSDALIYRLVFNLVENGIKYNRPGGAVRVTLQQEKQTAVLRITDTGPGIPADCRDSIFQPFFRVDKSRSREMGGVGLGLALVREIAVLHGGSVTVESSSENGTTFAVTLPLAQPC